MDLRNSAVEGTHSILCRNSWKDELIVDNTESDCFAMYQNKLEEIAKTMHIHLHQLLHLYIVHIRVRDKFGYNLQGKE